MPAMHVSAVSLPVGPLDAAAYFHAEIVPAIRADSEFADDIRVLFAPADHSHGGWRREAIAGLARELAPRRVNGIVGGDRESLAQMSEFLRDAPGVTGQIFTIDGKSGENV